MPNEPLAEIPTGRYCEPCDKWVPKRQTVCKACGADTVKVEVPSDDD